MKELIRQILKEEYVSLPIKLSGSYTVPKNAPSKGDALHSFNRRRSDGFGGYMLRGGPIPSRWSQYVKLDQGKGVNEVLKELIKKGVKPNVTDINIKVNDDYSVDWEVTIDESTDGKSYYGVSSRGSAGKNADSRAIGQISKLKSKNPEYCNWEEVLDLNITKPIKIRQFFFKYTKCKEDEESEDKLEDFKELENKFQDWESGIYELETDKLWTYKLTDDKKWEAKKGGGEFLSLEDSLSPDKYEEALNNLEDAVLVTTESIRKSIGRILKEESRLESKVLSMIKDVGFKVTANSVGGGKNLFKILGKKKELVMEYLLSFFDDLKIGKFRNDLHLVQGPFAFLEKSSSFWGGDIKIYDDYLSIVLKDVPVELYQEYRRDLLKELIRRYPEFNDGSEVFVYADRGLYRILDRFYVDERKDDEVITEETSLQKKLIGMIEKVGVINSVRSVGGLTNFKRIMGDYDYYTYDVLEEILEYELEELRNESEDWGLGEMNELDQLNAIEDLKIVNLVKVTKIKIYVDILTITNRHYFDEVMSELESRLQLNWNKGILLLENGIHNISGRGPGIDW